MVARLNVTLMRPLDCERWGQRLRLPGDQRARAAVRRHACGLIPMPAAPRPRGWAAPSEHARRHWALPPAHVLLRHAAVLRAAGGRSSEVVFEGDPAAPALAFLLDHRVRGRALLPATAMVEVFAGMALMAWQVKQQFPWPESYNQQHSRISHPRLVIEAALPL